MGEQLNIAKVVLEKSVDTLIDKAEDCFDRAKAGHEQADKQNEIAEVQHQNADKVEASAVGEGAGRRRGRTQGRDGNCRRAKQS